METEKGAEGTTNLKVAHKKRHEGIKVAHKIGRWQGNVAHKKELSVDKYAITMV